MPEKSWDYEGGLQWNPGGNYKADVTIFHRRDRNVIDYEKTGTIYVAENIQKLNFTGVEASVEARLRHEQRVQFAYTGLYGTQGELNGQQTKYVSNYPTHDAIVSWQGMLPGKLIARSRIGVINRYKQDPYALWDASIGRDFNHVRTHLSFANISDTQYQEIDGVIMPGRSVILAWNFYGAQNHTRSWDVNVCRRLAPSAKGCTQLLIEYEDRRGKPVSTWASLSTRSGCAFLQNRHRCDLDWLHGLLILITQQFSAITNCRRAPFAEDHVAIAF